MAGSLKEQNRWQLRIVMAVNSILLFAITNVHGFRSEGFPALFADARSLAPVGFGIVIVTVLNGILSAEIKARLVFLCWNHALPGHRAFTCYAKCDPRIDIDALTTICGRVLPVDPLEQNRTWYRIYKTVENEAAVVQVHRDYLLMRDYTGLSTIFIIFYGGLALLGTNSARDFAFYSVFLLAQYCFVRQAAYNYGVRLVTTVLALRAAKSH